MANVEEMSTFLYQCFLYVLCITRVSSYKISSPKNVYIEVIQRSFCKHKQSPTGFEVFVLWMQDLITRRYAFYAEKRPGER